MKKKLLLSILLFTTVFIISGCGKGTKEKDEETGKEKTTFTCIKNGIEKKDTDGKSYTMNVKEVAKVDEDGKLTYYSSKSTYLMGSKEDCEKSCEVAKKWNDEINDKNYSGTHRVTTCNCNDKEYFEERIYDDISNLDKFVRSDIQHLKDDNTFNLDEFISHYEKYGYNCN
jgi:hypothetical protein